MLGRVLKSTSHGSFSNTSCTSGVSFCSFTNTEPGEEETQKWWYFFIPVIPFSHGAKKSVQSKVGTMVLPSSQETSCAKLHSTDLFTTYAMACRLPTFVLLYWHLRSPKHQSGENLVCPTGRKERTMLLCLLVSARHTR